MTIEVRMPRSLPKRLSVVEAKARFSEVIRRAEGGDVVVIRRHGRPVAAVVPAADAETLRRLRAAGPEEGLAGLVGGWPGSGELVEQLARQRRTRPRARVRPG